MITVTVAYPLVKFFRAYYPIWLPPLVSQVIGIHSGQPTGYIADRILLISAAGRKIENRIPRPWQAQAKGRWVTDS